MKIVYFVTLYLYNIVCRQNFLHFFLGPSEVLLIFSGALAHTFFFFFLKNLFINFWLCWVFVAVHGFSLLTVHGCYSLVLCSLLIGVAPLVLEHRLQSEGSEAVVHGLSCPMACGIFLDQGLNLCPLQWLADSQLLDH